MPIKSTPGRVYRPSNGTEGELFADRYCDQCAKRGDEGDEETWCDIEFRVMICDIGDPEYPTEWIYGADGWPTCTAFQKRITP